MPLHRRIRSTSVIYEHHMREANKKRHQYEQERARKTVHRHIWGIGEKVEGRDTRVSKAKTGASRTQELTVKRALINAKTRRPD